MKIKLTEEKRNNLKYILSKFMENELDVELSEFKLNNLLDFCANKFGPAVYNGAIKDAHAYLNEKLIDMEMDLYADERNKS